MYSFTLYSNMVYLEDFVPEMIQQERLRLGLTIEEVAGVLGVEAATVAAWEQGEAEPAVSQLRGLAQLFECSPEQILARYSWGHRDRYFRS